MCCDNGYYGWHSVNSKPSWIKMCKDLSAHFFAFIQGKYDELHILFDRFDIPKSLKAATRHLWLGDSYPVAYHSTDTTNISNVPLKKLLSHTATKDGLTVFLSIELLKFSNRTSCIPLQVNIKQRHHIGISADVNKKLIPHAVDVCQNGATERTFFTEHRCICSLPKKIHRNSEGDYFSDRHREQMEGIST